jgi:hypothetical protein
VQRAGTFPKGHPQIIVAPDKVDLDNWFGLVKAEIRPPNALWLPVLPQKIGGKLLFVLCRKCALDAATAPCQHADKERGWVGSYTTEEVKLAVKQGTFFF